eukprot:403334299
MNNYRKESFNDLDDHEGYYEADGNSPDKRIQMSVKVNQNTNNHPPQSLDQNYDTNDQFHDSNSEGPYKLCHVCRHQILLPTQTPDEIEQKEILFESNIPRFSKQVVCPNSVYTSQNLITQSDNAKVFCIGGYITEPNVPQVKVVNWTLEYIKDPSNFIQPKNGMITPRYSHQIVYCEKLGRIYTFGGMGSSQGIQLMVLEDEEQNDQQNTWKAIKSMNYHREQGTACSFNDNLIYVFAGLDKSQENPDQIIQVIEKYDISSNQWEVINLPYIYGQSMRGAASFQGTENSLYIFGGKKSNETTTFKSSEILEFNTNDNSFNFNMSMATKIMALFYFHTL